MRAGSSKRVLTTTWAANNHSTVQDHRALIRVEYGKREEWQFASQRFSGPR
jgi:hypothetical protein